MSRNTPPRFFEWMLRRFLAARDRETISGDLLEEYREEYLPRLGAARADLWYLRQAAGFAALRLMGGPHVKVVLLLFSVFIAAAGGWLAVMENVLKHPGYSGRTLIAAAIVLEGLATLLCIAVNGQTVFRAIVSVGAAATGLVGLSAIASNVSGSHFEGFAVVIGAALAIQSALTIVFFRAGFPRST